MQKTTLEEVGETVFFSGLRESVGLLWNNQTLEQVHLKWRQTTELN
jgi:hypothetical protein